MSEKEGNSRWKRYPKYKDSGVEWLGEIPEGWRLIRLKFVCLINPSKSEIKKVLDELYVTFLPMELLGEDHSLNLTETRSLKDVWSGYTYFRENDIVLAKITPCF
jgi:type I restriction enzyme S subunit